MKQNGAEDLTKTKSKKVSERRGHKYKEIGEHGCEQGMGPYHLRGMYRSTKSPLVLCIPTV